MNPAHACRSLLFAHVLLLAACANNTHSLSMTVPASGETLSGALGIGSGARDITLTADDGYLACNGVSLLEYAKPGCKTSGSLRLECTDGRQVTGDWEMRDCRSGGGSGRDSLGRDVTFIIGAAAERALPVERQSRDIVPASDAGFVDSGYLFRFGGTYAAGFVAPALTPYEVVFHDAPTGLVIVDVGGNPLETVLSAMPPQAGQEAFVILPEGPIAGVRLKPDTAGEWQLQPADVGGSGMPVIGADGMLVGLVMKREGGTYLLDAMRLRRYLALVAPALAAQAPQAMETQRLRQRIMTPHVD